MDQFAFNVVLQVVHVLLLLHALDVWLGTMDLVLVLNALLLQVVHAIVQLQVHALDVWMVIMDLVLALSVLLQVAHVHPQNQANVRDVCLGTITIYLHVLNAVLSAVLVRGHIRLTALDAS